jgi:hypothetical protein
MGVALGIDIDLTTDFLEERLADNCKCESKHRAPGNKVCSIDVRWRVLSACSNLSFLVCDNHAKDNLQRMDDGWICARCDKPAADCWRVTPC